MPRDLDALRLALCYRKQGSSEFRRCLLGARGAVPAAKAERGYQFGQETFAGATCNGQDAPIPAVRWATIEC